MDWPSGILTIYPFAIRRVKHAWTNVALLLASSSPVRAQDALHRIPDKSRYSL